MKTIFFLGRNTESIIEDAKREFQELGEIIVISRDGDRLEPPEGLTALPVSKFEAENEDKYRLVVNGGTTAQSFPVLKKIVESWSTVEAFDLQPDSCTQVW